MSSGALRGAGAAWLSLIVLQGLVSRGGSSRIASLMADVNGLVLRALDPKVPAIPDHSRSTSSTSSAPIRVGGYPTTATDTGRATPRIPVPGLNAAQ